MTVARLLAVQLTQEQISLLIKNVVDDFSEIPGLLSIILFGSACAGTMTNASDLDVVLLFETESAAGYARRNIGTYRIKSIWPMDLLCVDRATFERKSKIGGIYFVARDEGRVIFGRCL